MAIILGVSGDRSVPACRLCSGGRERWRPRLVWVCGPFRSVPVSFSYVYVYVPGGVHPLLPPPMSFFYINIKKTGTVGTAPGSTAIAGLARSAPTGTPSERTGTCTENKRPLSRPFRQSLWSDPRMECGPAWIKSTFHTYIAQRSHSPRDPVLVSFDVLVLNPDTTGRLD